VWVSLHLVWPDVRSIDVPGVSVGCEVPGSRPWVREEGSPGQDYLA